MAGREVGKSVRHDTVTVINTTLDLAIDAISVGLLPTGIAVTPDGTKAYVANSGSNVSVIDTTTNTLSSSITAGNNPTAVAITPDGTFAYVCNYGDGTASSGIINSAFILCALNFLVLPCEAQLPPGYKAPEFLGYKEGLFNRIG